jgi:hypothetical protein
MKKETGDFSKEWKFTHPIVVEQCKRTVTPLRVRESEILQVLQPCQVANLLHLHASRGSVKLSLKWVGPDSRPPKKVKSLLAEIIIFSREKMPP